MSNYKQSTWWSIFLLFIYASIVNRYFNFTEEIIWLLINKNKGKNPEFQSSWYMYSEKQFEFLDFSFKIEDEDREKSVANYWKCLEEVFILTKLLLNPLQRQLKVYIDNFLDLGIQKCLLLGTLVTVFCCKQQKKKNNRQSNTYLLVTIFFSPQITRIGMSSTT